MAWVFFLVDLGIYGAAVTGTVMLPSLAAKLLSAIVAGAVISPLFVIGHDAAHGAYTDSRRLNGFIGRIAFLPALHNYSLWQMQHNRLHHRVTNLKNLNSWSPLHKADYDALPPWRRFVYRLYRSPLGFGPYYLVERWWKDKFIPRENNRKAHWLDFLLVASYLMLLLGALAYGGSHVPQSSVAGAIVLGFVVPFLIWNVLMGTTVFLQHTHRHVPWFEAMDEWNRLEGQEDVTVHVLYPRWFGVISHHIMDHPVHHVHPKIPLYRLRAAQLRLNELLGERAIIERFSLAYLLATLRSCKLYDYRSHCWLDFSGKPTSQCRVPAAQREMRSTAVA